MPVRFTASGPGGQKPVQEIEFLGGRLCLDFVNTANWHDDGTAFDERLTSLDDLRVWAVRQGLVPRSYQPEPNDDGLVDAFRSLRATIRRLLLAPDKADATGLALLNAARRTAAPPLANMNGCLALTPGKDLGWLRHELAQSACECLLTLDPKRIKACPGDRCGWLFLDESPNNRRRWCSMTTCGNRHKARRHYERRKAG